MPNPEQLWIDVAKLDALYEELCWGVDDELIFSIEGDKVVISNATLNGREDSLPL